MSQVLSNRTCFVCEKAGYQVKVDMEKTGTRPNGKAIWKLYEIGTNTEHQHKGQAAKVNHSEEYTRLNSKLDQIISILKGQNTLGDSS